MLRFFTFLCCKQQALRHWCHRIIVPAAGCFGCVLLVYINILTYRVSYCNGFVVEVHAIPLDAENLTSSQPIYFANNGYNIYRKTMAPKNHSPIK